MKQNKKGQETIGFLPFSLSQKLYSHFCASCGSTHSIEFAQQIHKFREHVSAQRDQEVAQG